MGSIPIGVGTMGLRCFPSFLSQAPGRNLDSHRATSCVSIKIVLIGTILSTLDLDRKRHTVKAFNGVRSSTSGEQTRETCITNNGQFPTGTSTKIGGDQWRSRRLSLPNSNLSAEE